MCGIFGQLPIYNGGQFCSNLWTSSVAMVILYPVDQVAVNKYNTDLNETLPSTIITAV